MPSSTTNKWLALVLLAAAQFVVVLDVSIVNVALPSIGEASTSRRRTCSGSSTRTRSCSAASCCSAGGWRTCSGAGALFMGGLVLFAVASLAGGLATRRGG